MTTLEQFSLFQRMAGSIKSDVEKGMNQKALGKIELLEGELGVFRQEYLEEEKKEEEFVENSSDIVETID